MPKPFATLIDEVQSALGDNTTTFTDAIVTVQLEDAFREVSDYEPYVVMHSFKLESRTGTATSGTTTKTLEDTGESQFLATDAQASGDIGMSKVIYNSTDNTWAKVISVTDGDTIGISKDIMASGEKYEMFNKGCRSNKQINIEDISDYVGSNHGVIAVEYKTQKSTRNFRNFTIEGDILTLDIDDSPPDSKVATSGNQPDVEVYVWFNTRQRVSQLTDLLGKIKNGPGYVADFRSIVVDDFSGSEVVAEDTLFTIDGTTGRNGIRGTYRVTKSSTLSGGEGTLLFYPGLADAIVDNAIVTVIGSSLNRRLERLVVDLTAARVGMAKFANSIAKGGQAVYSRHETKLGIVLAELERGQIPETRRSWPSD